MGIGAINDGCRAVFLDRDGVLNEPVVRNGKPYPPSALHELRITPGSAEALGRLKSSGLLLVVVTNQPDVARGTQQRAAVEEMNAALCHELPLDDVRVCYHDDRDGCLCRKPKPGLLLDAARAFGIDLRASFLVGDRWRDIDAGHAAECTTVLIDRGYAEKQPAVEPSYRAFSLIDAVDWILTRIANREERQADAHLRR